MLKGALKKESKKRQRELEKEEEDANPLNDPELEAELAALQSIRQEKEAKLHHGSEVVSHNNDHANYNKEGLLKCLADMETNNLPFIQTFEINSFTLPVINELDDIEREMAFYNHALEASIHGRKVLASLGIPITRPHDYFCENIKSDAHMSRIKDRLLIEEKKMEAFEQRKNREKNRKYNKQIALLKKQEKNTEKKQLLSEIDEIKRASKDGKEGGKDEKLNRLLNSTSSSSSRGQNGGTSGGDFQKSKKRMNMDRKYGFGGKDKKRAKLNDSKSINDMREFSPRGGKFARKGGSGGKPSGGGRAGGGKSYGGRSGGGFSGKKSGGNRPGKDARQKARTAKSGN